MTALIKNIKYLFLLFMLGMLCMPIYAAAKEGALILKFTSSKYPTHEAIVKALKADGQLQAIIKQINSDLILPQDIQVIFHDGEGPLYDPRINTIYMSYDYMKYLSDLYKQLYPKATQKEIMNFILSATIFLFYHELAHALIDVYKLPVVSNEENAADNLAVVLALEVEYTANGYDVVMGSALYFRIMDSTKKEYKDDDLWDEHALDLQRYYNVLCLAYAKHPKQVMAELKIINNEKLFKFIKDKANYCAETYEKQMLGWFKLLEPHLRQ